LAQWRFTERLSLEAGMISTTILKENTMHHEKVSSETNTTAIAMPTTSPPVDPSPELLEFMTLLGRVLAQRWMAETRLCDPGALFTCTPSNE
jgi:hypothetical protein